MDFEPIVTIDWLTSHFDDVVICDVRAYLDGRSGREAYGKAHLPGARFIDLDSVLAAPSGPIVGRHPLPDPATFAQGMSDAGITHETVVIAYDDAAGMIAGRLVWMLRVHGQPAALLDGGIDAWKGSLESEAPTVAPVEHPVREWPQRALANADEVAEFLDAGGLVVDSRAAPRFRGEHEPIDPKPGHIPGAINLPFADNINNGHFLAREELRTRFTAAGVGGDTVYYCGSGVSACNNMLAAEAAGLPLGRLYVGSWSGWSSDDTRPVATG